MFRKMLRKISLLVLVFPLLVIDLHALAGGKSPDPRPKDSSTMNPGQGQYLIDSGQAIKYASGWSFSVGKGYVVFDIEAIYNQAVWGMQTIDILFSDNKDDNQSLCKIHFSNGHNKATAALTDKDNHDYTKNDYTADSSFPDSTLSFWITFDNGTISFGKGRDYTDSSTVLTTWKLQQSFKNKKTFFTFSDAGSYGYYLMIKNVTCGKKRKSKKA